MKLLNFFDKALQSAGAFAKAMFLFGIPIGFCAYCILTDPNLAGMGGFSSRLYAALFQSDINPSLVCAWAFVWQSVIVVFLTFEAQIEAFTKSVDNEAFTKFTVILFRIFLIGGFIILLSLACMILISNIIGFIVVNPVILFPIFIVSCAILCK